jgi:hypothetical protein
MGTTLNNTDMPVYRCKLYSQFDKLVSIIIIVFLTQNVTSVQKFQRPMK